jgi:hypothetical protein
MGEKAAAMTAASAERIKQVEVKTRTKVEVRAKVKVELETGERAGTTPCFS